MRIKGLSKMAMRAHPLAGIAIAALTLPAMAADMPVKAPPLPPAPVYSWAGFYIGANGGYGVGRDPVTMTTVSGAGFPGLGAGTALYGDPRRFALAPHGWTAGGQAGYNWQAAPGWVFGVETDIQGTGMKDSTSCILACNARIAAAPGPALFPAVFTDISAAHRLNWFGTVRGRVGATAGSALFYVTGGFAYGEVERSARVAGSTVGAIVGNTVNTFAGSFNNTSTKTGWTVGGGVEGKLFGGWSAKAEYLYVDLGSTRDSFNTVYLTGGGGAVAGSVAANRVDSSSIHDHIFRVGLNYQLGGGGDPAYAAMAAATPARSARNARAQVPGAPVYNWAGLYLGPNFGYGNGRDWTTMTTVSAFAGLPVGTALYGAPRQFALAPRGFVGGGGAGYNWQLTPIWLAGVEADLQATDMHDRATCLLSCNARISPVPGLEPVSRRLQRRFGCAQAELARHRARPCRCDGRFRPVLRHRRRCFRRGRADGARCRQDSRRHHRNDHQHLRRLVRQ
jgi:outer membrane immunogenic protein